MSAQEKFEEIADKVSSDAALIECPVSEYIEGLDTIIQRLLIDKEAAQLDAG